MSFQSKIWIRFTIFFFLTTIFIHGQIPIPCANNFTKKLDICCPLSKINGLQCGGPQRGFCSKYKVDPNAVGTYLEYDVRLNWPLGLFKKLCRCKGKFYGYACDQCWYGWEGKYCDKKVIKVRRNIMKYSDHERILFLKVLNQLRNTTSSEYAVILEGFGGKASGWRYGNLHEIIVNIHFFAQRPPITTNVDKCDDNNVLDFAHNGVGFLTFHRHLMMLWERWAGEVAQQLYGVSNFMFPYWDWTNKLTCEMCTNKWFGAEGKHSPDDSAYLDQGSAFYKWKVYCDITDVKDDVYINMCNPCSACANSEKITRKWDKAPFPKKEHVEYCLSRNIYSNVTGCSGFAEAIEGDCPPKAWGMSQSMHNQVHNEFSGTFMTGSTSPNDPLFIVHHLQLDRILQLWWMKKPKTAKVYSNDSSSIGHCYNCYQVGFLPPVTNADFFKNSSDLGYQYDSYQFG